MFDKINESVVARIVKNIRLLESRNPDLAEFLGMFDQCLEEFLKKREKVEDSQAPVPDAVPKTVVSPFPVSVPAPVSVTGKAGEEIRREVPARTCPQAPVAPASGGDAAGAVVQGRNTSGASLDLPSDIGPDNIYRVAMGSLRPEDIDQLERRLLLKIEASRWALERDRLLKATANFQTEIEPHDHELLSRARELTNCYLWMNNPETAPVMATGTYELLAEAYHAAAICVGFLRTLVDLVDNSPKSEVLSRILRDALYITATAQSALRRVTYDVSGREDQDQIRIHRWLTYLTKRYSIYVNRHMKKDSLAPVEKIPLIPEIIAKLQEELDKLGKKQKVLADGFGRIQYHASRIRSGQGTKYDWDKIIETVDELVDAGTRAADSRFQECLADILPQLNAPPTYKEHPFFVNVLMELDYWHNNAHQRELIEQEVSAAPVKPTIDPDEDITEGYPSLWDELDGSVSSAAPDSGKEKPQAAPLFVDFAAPRRSGGFGDGILPSDAVPPVNYAKPLCADEVLSYDAVVAECAHTKVPRSSSEDEILNRAHKAIGESVLLWVGSPADDALADALAHAADVKIYKANADIAASESRLAQVVHPGQVAIVLVMEGAIPDSNRNVENFCKRYDKPHLRLPANATLATIARQVVAALALWG